MILYFVLVGFLAGALGASAVVMAGGGVLLALLAYSLGGALGVVLVAILTALAPTFPRSRPRGGLPAGVRPAHARAIHPRAPQARAAHAARPVRPRLLRASGQPRR